MGADICKALEICESAHIVHANIKPENIFVSKFGEFKLGDFSLAKSIQTENTTVIRRRNIGYMAPEVYRGYDCSFSSDLYALGMVMYQFLNQGRMPYMPNYPAKITYQDEEKAILRRMNGEALTKPENMSEELFAIVSRMCAQNAEQRFQSAREVREKLSNLLKTGHEELDMNATVSIFSSKMRKERMEKFKKMQETKENTDEAEHVEEINRMKDKQEEPIKEEVKKEQEATLEQRGTEPEIKVKPSKNNMKKETQKQRKPRRKLTNRGIGLIIALVTLALMGLAVFLNQPPKPVEEVEQQEEQKQSKQIVVPNVVGMNFNNAKEILEAVGFKVKEKSVQKESTVNGKVVAQSLKAETKEEEGTEITLQVVRNK